MFARLFAFLLVACSSLYAQPPLEAIYLEVSVYEDAVKIAQEQRRSIYLVFRGEGCVWCERQEGEMSNPSSTEAMDGLVVCVVDIAERKDLRLKYGVRMIPAHRLLDPDGTVVRSAVGYLDASRFGRFLAR